METESVTLTRTALVHGILWCAGLRILGIDPSSSQEEGSPLPLLGATSWATRFFISLTLAIRRTQAMLILWSTSTLPWSRKESYSKTFSPRSWVNVHGRCVFGVWILALLSPYSSLVLCLYRQYLLVASLTWCQFFEAGAGYERRWGGQDCILPPSAINIPALLPHANGEQRLLFM